MWLLSRRREPSAKEAAGGVDARSVDAEGVGIATQTPASSHWSKGLSNGMHPSGALAGFSKSTRQPTRAAICRFAGGYLASFDNDQYSEMPTSTTICKPTRSTLMSVGTALVSLGHHADDSLRQKGEGPGIHKRSEQGDHGTRCLSTAFRRAMGDGDRDRDQSQDRQQVDRTEGSPKPVLEDKQRNDALDDHQRAPDPA